MEVELSLEEPSPEETDLLCRSKKKVHNDNGVFEGSSSRVPRDESWMTDDPPEKEAMKLSKKSFAELVKTGSYGQTGSSDEEEMDKDKLEADEGNREADFANQSPRLEANRNIRDCRFPGITVVQWEDGLFNIVIPEAEKRKLAKPWRNTLIVKLLRRRISYGVLKKRLEALWAKHGSIDIIDVGNDFFLVKFYSFDDYDHALTEGPWLIFYHYLAVRKWQPDFDPFKASIECIAAWIRHPGLAVEYYDTEVLSQVGDNIGIDANTKLQYWGKFARLCVELDLEKPLQPWFLVNGKMHMIEYEGLHQVCFACGRFGHAKGNCTQQKAQDSPLPPPHKEGKGVDDGPNRGYEQPEVGDKGKDGIQQENGPYGPWMVVQKQHRTQRGAKSENYAEVVGGQ